MSAARSIRVGFSSGAVTDDDLAQVEARRRRLEEQINAPGFVGRCPKCRALGTIRMPGGAIVLGCKACGLPVLAAGRDIDPDPVWVARAERREMTWDRFTPTYALEEADQEHKLAVEAAEQEFTLDYDVIAAQVRAVVGSNPCEIDVEVVGALSLMIWGVPTHRIGDAMSRRAWYVKNPKRAQFATLGAALRATRGEMGMGPINLQIAESKTHARPAGLRRCGVVHVQASRNGCTGGTKGGARLDKAIDVDRAIARSGISAEDVWLLRVMHEDEEAKPDRWAATAALLERRGELPFCEHQKPACEKTEACVAVEKERQRIVAAALDTVSKRLARAARQIEIALRKEARFPNSKEDGQPHDPDAAPILRLRERYEEERDERPGLAKTQGDVDAVDWSAEVPT